MPQLVYLCCLMCQLLCSTVLLGREDEPTFYQTVSFSPGETGYCLSAASDSILWFTTSHGVFHLQDSKVVHHLDASAFTSTNIEMLNISAVSDSDVWALGHDVRNWSKRLHWFDGEDWHERPFPQATEETDDDLVVHRLIMYKKGEITRGFACGQYGLVYEFDGKNWSRYFLETKNTLRSLFIRDHQTMLIGGRGGILYTGNGESWQAVENAPSGDNYIFATSILADGSRFAGGTDLWYYDGSNWGATASPFNSAVRDLQMISAEDGWMVSQQGEIARFDGSKWNRVAEIPHQPNSNCIGLSVVGDPDNYDVFMFGIRGLYKSHWLRVPTFEDISTLTNLHLDGGKPQLADFDQDGNTDLYVTAARGGYPARLYRNRGDGVFSDMTDRLPEFAPVISATVPIVDIDNNGYPDILISRSGTEDLWYLNNGNWEFETRPVVIRDAESNTFHTSLAHVQFADLDLDGDLDIIFTETNASHDSTIFLATLNDGIGRFPSGARHLIRSSANYRPDKLFILADLNQDRIQDIININYDSPVAYYESRGAMAYEERATAAGIDSTVFEASPYIMDAIAADINNDLFIDLLLLWRQGELAVLINDGQTRFTSAQTLNLDMSLNNFEMSLVDIDSDGDRDLFLQDRFYKNDAGQFNPFPQTGFKLRGYVSFADLDRDGDPDIIHHHPDWRLGIYKNSFNPTNILIANIRGVSSNYFGLGTSVIAASFSDLNTPAQTQMLSVDNTLPLSIGLNPQLRHELILNFADGTRHRVNNVTAGQEMFYETGAPKRYPLVVYYALRQSLRRSSTAAELTKLFIFLALIVAMFFVLKNRDLSAGKSTIMLFPILAVVYIISFHLTIDHGQLISALIQFAAIALLAALAIGIIEHRHRKRMATYISRYRLHEQIGQGGMGTVYRATDTANDELVAIKVLNDELLEDQENKRRFANEGQLLSSFSHPHIVKVHEVGEHHQRGFIAMEYLDGGTLYQQIKDSHPISESTVSRWLYQIALGLRELHGKDIIHRDIKSGNMMLDEFGNIRIMDFGLSKSHLVTTMTSLGTVIGTLGYVAPEQITGSMVDQRVDIFSYGVMAYELVCGELPFTGENEMALIHSIFNTIPPPPSELREGIDTSWDKFIMHCMQKQPEDRFQDIDTLLSQLPVK